MTYDPAFEQRVYSAIGAAIRQASMIGDDVAAVRVAETTRALMRALGMTTAMAPESADEAIVTRLQDDLADQIERARRNPKLAEFVRRTRPMGRA
ncbi:hypothetical protein I6F20_17025 [Bradyrhizobium sp. IC3123]|uniref:hypothetical protein n=1 Tax=Bradyrhizobium sp. IC3123 TaxID=2793803 RepID=UPI001CD4CFAF|nr:hypothetical protein [Bradyrhizobium sp. IC3123]MCA1390771.1 hypothetical protein [Bradyrhizobium sp. IC3123]